MWLDIAVAEDQETAVLVVQEPVIEMSVSLPQQQQEPERPLEVNAQHRPLSNEEFIQRPEPAVLTTNIT